MTVFIEREFRKSEKNRSFFLFGPRQTGKTSLISRFLEKTNRKFSIDLLKSDIFFKYNADPSRLRKEIDFEMSAGQGELNVFIDEIQKCPALLDEVHVLIEKYKPGITFILTGSSARKLKRSAANMLGGRALNKSLHPLTYRELGPGFDLEKVIAGGSLPPFYLLDPEEKSDYLQAYVNTYLKEEVMDEALTRNVPAFSRFLTLAGESSGEIINYSNIAREAGVSSKTVREYYQILEDTLLGFPLPSYLKSVRKQLVQHPRFYLFDLGVINQLSGRNVNVIPRGSVAWGKLFEHLVVLEIKRFMDYRGKNWRLYFWRTKAGHEVDVIIRTENTLYAVEIKGGRNPGKRDLKGLKSFHAEHPGCVPLCAANTDTPFMLEGVPVIPWQSLFEEDYLGHCE